MPPTTPESALERPLAERLSDINQRIEKAKQESLLYSRVLLLGASKGQGQACLREAIGLGMCDFGENRVQEAQDKWLGLKAEFPHVRLHFIGALQTNKAREAVALFDMIQSVDREKLVDVLAAEMERQGKRVPCLVQVNIGEEPQKAGCLPDVLPGLLAYAKGAGLDVRGLMCVPPAEGHPAPYFALLAKLAKQHGLAELSMGMSEDFETAIRMGATCVRLGRVLFGERT